MGHPHCVRQAYPRSLPAGSPLPPRKSGQGVILSGNRPRTSNHSINGQTACNSLLVARKGNIRLRPKTQRAANPTGTPGTLTPGTPSAGGRRTPEQVKNPESWIAPVGCTSKAMARDGRPARDSQGERTRWLTTGTVGPSRRDQARAQRRQAHPRAPAPGRVSRTAPPPVGMRGGVGAG